METFMQLAFAEMKQPPDAVLKIFAVLFVFTTVWLILALTCAMIIQRRRGVKFPKLEMVNIRFQESWASGHSLKSFFTRIGGANNCLKIVVTDDELWVRMPFPFNVFSIPLDLEHRIPLESITDLHRRKRLVVITYTREDGTSRTIELLLRKTDQFWAAMTDADQI